MDQRSWIEKAGPTRWAECPKSAPLAYSLMIIHINLKLALDESQKTEEGAKSRMTETALSCHLTLSHVLESSHPALSSCTNQACSL